MYSALLAGTIWALSVGHALAAVQYGGVNIAGFDFGCEISVRAQLLPSIMTCLTKANSGNL